MPKPRGGARACSAAGSRVPVVVVPWHLACGQCKSSLTFLPTDLWGSSVKPNLKDTASPACRQPPQRLALRSGHPVSGGACPWRGQQPAASVAAVPHRLTGTLTLTVFQQVLFMRSRHHFLSHFSREEMRKHWASATCQQILLPCGPQQTNHTASL